MMTIIMIILESVLIVTLALMLDLAAGDPKSRYHPTAWIGKLIAKIVPHTKNFSPRTERLGGIAVVLIPTIIVAALVFLLDVGINLIDSDVVVFFISMIAGAILLKTTIAIKGMEKHAITVVKYLERGDIVSARTGLSMIVKRKTNDLDKNHVLSGVLESVSENTVDGVTGPLFYYAFFGLPGAFIYRTINTIDSMIGYKTRFFQNIGWFGANCDKILNYLPARITGLVMILAAMILGDDWRGTYQTMKKDGRKPQSPNAGYPMAALAGSLGTRFEKVNHYTIGDGTFELTTDHIKSAISLMKVTSILFCGMITIPIIVVLSYLGLWWLGINA
jgi:adenosylcobinamide-phosphate synthase